MKSLILKLSLLFSIVLTTILVPTLILIPKKSNQPPIETSSTLENFEFIKISGHAFSFKFEYVQREGDFDFYWTLYEETSNGEYRIFFYSPTISYEEINKDASNWIYYGWDNYSDYDTNLRLKRNTKYDLVLSMNNINYSNVFTSSAYSFSPKVYGVGNLDNAVITNNSITIPYYIKMHDRNWLELSWNIAPFFTGDCSGISSQVCDDFRNSAIQLPRFNNDRNVGDYVIYDQEIIFTNLNPDTEYWIQYIERGESLIEEVHSYYQPIKTLSI